MDCLLKKAIGRVKPAQERDDVGLILKVHWARMPKLFGDNTSLHMLQVLNMVFKFTLIDFDLEFDLPF